MVYCGGDKLKIIWDINSDGYKQRGIYIFTCLVYIWVVFIAQFFVCIRVADLSEILYFKDLFSKYLNNTNTKKCLSYYIHKASFNFISLFA